MSAPSNGTATAVMSTTQSIANQNQIVFDAIRENSPQKNQTISSSETVPPTITITSSDGDRTIDGMLDRISHDLDYLLNRTMEIPKQVRRSNENSNQNCDATATISCATDQIPPPPPPPSQTMISSNVLHSHPNLSVHEVILEEAED